MSVRDILIKIQRVNDHGEVRHVFCARCLPRLKLEHCLIPLRNGGLSLHCFFYSLILCLYFLAFILKGNYCCPDFYLKRKLPSFYKVKKNIIFIYVD